MDEAQKTKKRQEAEEHLKKANKFLQKTFFRPALLVDAAPEFQLAGDAFRAAGDWEKAKQAFYLCLETHIKDDFVCNPADNIEKVAKIANQQLREKDIGTADKLALVAEAMRAHETASGLYLKMNEVNRAAEALSKAADVSEAYGMTKEPKELYERACAMVDTTTQTWYVTDVFHKTLEFLVKLQLFKEAHGIVTRQIELFRSDGQYYNTVKCYVNELILLLAMNDVAAADKTFTQQREDKKFLQSDEFALAEGLIQAYKKNDEELLKTTIYKKEFDLLDCKQIASLARKLTLFAGSEPSGP